MGIENALQLADSSTWVMRNHFNVVLERTVRELRGESCLVLDEFASTKQQIICSRSFGHRITEYRDMHQAICAYAERAAEKDGFRYMKAGVMLSDFFSQGVAQLNLFDEYQPRQNSDALMDVVDSLNHSGRGTIWFAGQGIQKSWSMKREMLSPGYTTRYADLPVAR